MELSKLWNYYYYYYISFILIRKRFYLSHIYKNRLFRPLESYGVEGDLLECYLRDRKQRVVLNGQISG